MGTEWKASEAEENVYEGRDRATGEVTWTATAVDLVFGAQRPAAGHRRRSTPPTTRRSSSCATSCRLDKVMNADRFDLR